MNEDESGPAVVGRTLITLMQALGYTRLAPIMARHVRETTQNFGGVQVVES